MHVTHLINISAANRCLTITPFVALIFRQSPDHSRGTVAAYINIQRFNGSTIHMIPEFQAAP